MPTASRMLSVPSKFGDDRVAEDLAGIGRVQDGFHDVARGDDADDERDEDLQRAEAVALQAEQERT